MTPAVLVAALAAVVIWSAGPVATKLAVAELPVLAVAALFSVPAFDPGVVPGTAPGSRVWSPVPPGSGSQPVRASATPATIR